MSKKGTTKIYNIYAKERCIYENLSESEFIQIWDMLDKFLMVSGVLSKSEVRYEKITVPLT